MADSIPTPFDVKLMNILATLMFAACGVLLLANQRTQWTTGITSVVGADQQFLDALDLSRRSPSAPSSCSRLEMI